MKQYKSHKLYVFRNVLFLLSIVAAVTVGMRLKATSDAVVPSAAARESWQTAYAKLPLSFEINRGQARKQIEFLARGDGYNLALMPGEAVLSLSKSGAKSVIATLQIRLEGANKKARVNGLEQLGGKSNYFIGNDPQKWQTDVPTFARVKYEAVYPGVDAVFYGNQRQLEYDFVVAPGADPKAIRLNFSGARSVRLDDNGELVLATAVGEVRQHRPIVYQQINGSRQTVEGGYKLKGSEATFELGAYDVSQPLVIDPVVSYATLFGEDASKDISRAFAVDAKGDVYITGQSNSGSFPALFIINPVNGQPMPSNATAAFVTKLNSTGTSVIYSTLISGTRGFKASQSGLEILSSSGSGIVVDAAGNAIVGGNTQSFDFPTTNGAYKAAYTPSVEGPTDAFVLRLNAAGNGLLSSTMLGGIGHEAIGGVVLDATGNTCVVGTTSSTDFPNGDSTVGKIDASQAAFVARISADGSTLVNSTVLDSAGAEQGRAITTDAAGNLYIAGITYDGYINGSGILGTRFPRTPGVYQKDFNPIGTPGWGLQIGGFVARFSANGLLVFSSLLGDGQPQGIALDRDGNVCVVGWSQFIRTLGTFGKPDYQQFDVFPRTDSTMVYQDSPTLGPQTGGAFLLKLSSMGTNVVLSHRFGLPSGDPARGVAVDGQGNIHITGSTSLGFISPDGVVELEDLSSLYPYAEGSNYAYHLKFAADGKTVLGVDFFRSAQGNAVALDPAGNVYLLGVAGAGFKATPGALQTQLPVTEQPRIYFVARLGNGSNPGATPTPTTPTPTPTPAFHNITGRVTDFVGKPMVGIPVSLTGTAAASARTDGSGYFSFRNLRDEGVYRITPAQRGPTINFKTYYPNPGWREFDGLERDEAANFSYSLTSPWVPPNATPTPTPTPVATPTPTPPPTQGGLLVNPSFDDGNLGWATTGMVVFTNGVARMTPTSSLSPASVGQLVQLTAGATYVLTADVAASSTARSTLSVSFDNGASGGAQPFNNVQQPRTVRVTFTVPAGVSQARIYVQTNGSFSASSWATADNFTLTRTN